MPSGNVEHTFWRLSAFGANSEKDNKENSPKRPNVLVLLTDDQTFSTIHAWGNNEIQTPNMDRLVNQGMSFTQTHVMGGLNGAISQPSRAMLLTRTRSDGRTPQRTSHPQK